MRKVQAWKKYGFELYFCVCICVCVKIKFRFFAVKTRRHLMFYFQQSGISFVTGFSPLTNTEPYTERHSAVNVVRSESNKRTLYPLPHHTPQHTCSHALHPSSPSLSRMHRFHSPCPPDGKPLSHFQLFPSLCSLHVISHCVLSALILNCLSHLFLLSLLTAILLFQIPLLFDLELET